MTRTSTSLLVLCIGLLLASPAMAGTHIVKYPSGQIRWKVQLKSGLPSGPSTAYHTNGGVASRGTYVAGQKHGLFEYWDNAGRATRRVLYANGAVKSKTDLSPSTTALSRRADAQRQALARFHRSLRAARSTKRRGIFVGGVGVAGFALGTFLLRTKEQGEPAECSEDCGIGGPNDRELGGALLMAGGLAAVVVGLAVWGNGSAAEARVRRSYKVRLDGSRTRVGVRLHVSF